MEAKTVLLFDDHRRIMAASPASAVLLGVPEEELVGLACREVFGCPECTGDACPLRQALAGEPSEGLLPSERPLAVSTSPVRGAGAESRLVLVHLREPENREIPLSAGLQPVLDSLREMLRSDLAALAVYNENAREINWQVTSGSVSSDVTQIRLRPGQGFAGRIILTELPLRTFRFPEDLTVDPGSYPIFLTEGLRSAIGVPIQGQGRVLGVLMVASRLPREYTDDELVRLTQVADSIALAAEMMCLYGDAIRMERAKLAHEVHDGLSQNLFGLKLLLYDAQLDSPEVLAGRLEQFRLLLDGTLSEVRRLISDLRGAARCEPGLLGALTDYLQDFYGLTHLPVELAIRLAPGEEVPCYDVHEALRIMQEALMNIYRHADAAHVWVEVAREEDAYRITLADDGKGFDPHQPATEGHFGLQIMRERAACLRGDLTVQSAPGRGTAVILRLPG